MAWLPTKHMAEHQTRDSCFIAPSLSHSAMPRCLEEPVEIWLEYGIEFGDQLQTSAQPWTQQACCEAKTQRVCGGTQI